MKRRLIFVLFIVFSYTAVTVSAQDVYYMSFIENLRLRQGPTLKSGVIRLLEKYEKIILIEKGKQEVIDNILGSWLKVKTLKGETGYCFDGYCVFADKNDSAEPNYAYNVEKMLPGLWQQDFIITNIPAREINLTRDGRYWSIYGGEKDKEYRWRYDPDKNALLVIEDSKIISRHLIKQISYGYMVLEYPERKESVAFAKWTTELHDAVQCGNVLKIQFLVEHGFDVNTLIFNSHVPLHLAVALEGSQACHKVAIVEYLLSKGADVTQENMYGFTPLNKVWGEYRRETAALLLSYGADINHLAGQNETLFSRTLLTMSFSSLTGEGFESDWEFVLFLVDNKADITLKEHGGRSYLLPLVREDSTLLEEVICRAGRPSLKDNSDLLITAAASGYYKTAEFLLDYGVDVNGTGVSSSGRTALHEAAEGGDAEIVSLLIKRGALLNIKDDKGDTPLHCVAAGCESYKTGCASVISILLKAGADINIKNKRGRTPLHTATAYDNRNAVNALLKNHAQINLQDSKGNTSLHLAVMNVGHYSSWRQYQDIIEMLLDYGALTTIKNKEGKSVLDIADELNDNSLKRLLTEADKIK
jgi:ankyrin repeat protein